jgi:hypothetical protein
MSNVEELETRAKHSPNKDWYEDTKRDGYLPLLKLDMGREYVLKLTEEPRKVFTKYLYKAVLLTVECDGKIWCMFPGADLKRKLRELEQRRGGSLKDAVIMVVQVKKQSASGKRFVYIYTLSEVT